LGASAALQYGQDIGIAKKAALWMDAQHNCLPAFSPFANLLNMR